MNGIHDMGGMTCYGSVKPEENEPVFHAEWEKRMFAMTMLGMGQLDTLDGFRHAIERMDPAHYLSSTYYEHWLAALESIVLEKGLLTPEELTSGITTGTRQEAPGPLPPEAVSTVVHGGAPTNRETGRLTPRFKAGDKVRARNLNPTGHTRQPRYVRGKNGVIAHVHGTFVYPDANAHGKGEQPQPLYSVCFDAQELWGPDVSAIDRRYIDLWEDYLDPA